MLIIAAWSRCLTAQVSERPTAWQPWHGICLPLSGTSGDACATGVATRLLASLLNPYSGEVRLAAQATLQHITQAAPRAHVWLLQLLGTAQAVLMGEQTLVRTLICGPRSALS